MDVKWINDGRVEIGNFCTAQGKLLVVALNLRPLNMTLQIGVIQQLGETGVAMTTLVRIPPSIHQTGLLNTRRFILVDCHLHIYRCMVANRYGCALRPSR